MNKKRKLRVEIEQDLSLLKGQSHDVIAGYIEDLGPDKNLGLLVLKTICPEVYEILTRPLKSQTMFAK